MNKVIKLLLLGAVSSAILALNGCSSVAQARWEGRDVQEALDLFGKPDLMKKKTGPNGEPLAVLTWHKSSSWTNTEAAGTSMNHTSSGMVYTEHYFFGLINSCLKFTCRAVPNSLIVLFRIEDGRILHGKCTNVPYVPGYIPPGF